MTAVDPVAAQSWRMLSERVAAEPDARRQAMLRTVARHVEAEVAGDVDELLATLIDHPRYHFWGRSGLDGPKGRDAVVAHYEMLNASGINRLEFEITRVMVDDAAVLTEGWFRHAYGGTMLQLLDLGDDVDGSGWYLVEYLALVVWPFDGDLIVGEDIYFGTDPKVVRQLSGGELTHLGPLDRT